MTAPVSVEIRVIYGDTDQAGIVYYANYLRFFEASRGAFLRERGRSYLEIEAAGMTMPVIEAHVKYLRPARYEDLLVVEVRLEKVRGASLRFEYDVKRDGEVIAQGFTEHACIGRDGRPRRFPAELRALLERGV
jgi:acyl-CoA thioester hydrolase